MPEDERVRDEEEEGFTKVDKRHSRSEAEAVAEPEAAGEPQPEDGPQSLAEIGVYGVLRFSLSLLSQQAWVALGVQAVGGEMQPNLAEAKVAIDTIALLSAQLQPDFTAEEKRELETLLANLRVNYIQRAG